MFKIVRRWKRGGRKGNSLVEFAVVMILLVPMFAGMFSLGMTLAKGIQVSNVARDAVVLMVRSNTDPTSGLDLSLAQNQRLIVRTAAGLGMNKNAQYDPSPTGSGVVVLTRVVLVGPQECSTGVIPAPPSAPPWTSSNCPNFGQYAFAYRVVIGNGTRWSSRLGDPPSGVVRSDGTISAVDIATNGANLAQGFGPGGIITLMPSTFTMISEMFADVSNLNVFSIWQTPIIYSRSIS